MSNLKPAVLHAIAVGAHILVSILLVGGAILAFAHPEVFDQFAAYIVKFGIPVGVANMIVAGLKVFLQSEIPNASQPPTQTPQV